MSQARFVSKPKDVDVKEAMDLIKLNVGFFIQLFSPNNKEFLKMIASDEELKKIYKAFDDSLYESIQEQAIEKGSPADVYKPISSFQEIGALRQAIREINQPVPPSLMHPLIELFSQHPVLVGFFKKNASTLREYAKQWRDPYQEGNNSFLKEKALVTLKGKIDASASFEDPDTKNKFLNFVTEKLQAIDPFLPPQEYRTIAIDVMKNEMLLLHLSKGDKLSKADEKAVTRAIRQALIRCLQAYELTEESKRLLANPQLIADIAMKVKQNIPKIKTPIYAREYQEVVTKMIDRVVNTQFFILNIPKKKSPAEKPAEKPPQEVPGFKRGRHQS